MELFFKWNMFFTSFLPLWISIIVNDICTMLETGLGYFSNYSLDGLLSSGMLSLISGYLIKCIIQISTILILSLGIIISIKSINIEINKQNKVNNPNIGRIVKAKRANKLSAEFLLAYILPMIAFDYDEVKSLVLFCIYFAVLSYLCIRNNNIYTNIYLEFKKYKMYECDIKCSIINTSKVYTDCIIISKNDLAQTVPRDISYFDFDKYVYIELEGNNGERENN